MRPIKMMQNALKKYMLYRIDNGPYKFFIQKLEAKPEVDLACNIFSSDYFRHNLKPLPFNISEFDRILVFAPHQDDEAIGCGGLLSRLSDEGKEIHIVFLTDGENKTGKMKDVRHKEALNLTTKLGATMHEIGISNVNLSINNTHIKKISDILNNISPDAIFSTWPLDLPPIHRLCNVVVTKAILGTDIDVNKLPIFSYQVHTTLLPNVYYDYTALFSRKQELIGCYISQLADQNYQHLSAGLDAWNSRLLPWSSDKRYVELYTRLPANAYIEIIKKFYPKDLSQTFKGNDKCINAYKKLSRIDNE